MWMKTTAVLLIGIAAIVGFVGLRAQPVDPPGQVAKPDRYDFRQTEAYRQLPDADREKLEQVHRDFVLLWGALDMYADNHGGAPPDSLDDLTPLFLRELPKDPFIAAETAERAARDEDRVNRTSLKGWGYQYRKGSPGNRAWIISSVGLKGFPYLAERGNVDLYICKGDWTSGFNPRMTE